MEDRKPLSTIVFDVNETLLDITTLEPLFQRLFGDAQVMREWFAELILYSQTLNLSGQYVPFGDLAGGVLGMVGENRGVAVKGEDLSELASLISSMPAHADVEPALEALRGAGFQLVTLTNSAPAESPTPLEKAGIATFFDAHFSVADVRKFKPHPATYHMVAEHLGKSTSELCLLACHIWDTIGAQSLGFKGAFIARPNNSVLVAPGVARPDFVSADLRDLARQIISAESAGG